jgi:hypothetical protein
MWKFKTKVNDTEISEQSKALLAVFATEILRCKTIGQVIALTKTWVNANNLSVDRVTTMTSKQYEEYFKRGQ